MVDSYENSYLEMDTLSMKDDELEEAVDDLVVRDIWELEAKQSYVAELKAKCGEVIFESIQKFTLVCSLCGQQFEDLETFGEHILDTHLKSNDDDDDCKPFECLYMNEIKLGDTLNANDERMNVVVDENESTTESDVQEIASDVTSEGEQNSTDDDARDDDEASSSVQKMGEECFLCTVCGAKYSHKRSFFAHARKEHGILTKRMKLKLEKCVKHEKCTSSRPASVEDDKDVASTSRSENFSCTICNRSYKHKRSLLTHIRSSHEEKSIAAKPKRRKCKFCGESFLDKLAHELHMEENHIGETKYPCTHCERSFRTRHGRQIHIYTHTGERPYSCPHCTKAFSVQSNLQKHIDAHLNIKKYACQFCSKTFVQSSERKTHERRHTGERPFQCEQCGKRFIEHSILSRHRMRHANIRPFKCDICDKAFFTAAMLNDHIIAHGDERPFKCEICDNSFSRRKSLRQHQQLHMTVKQYTCKVCNKAFSQAAGLYSHMKSHRLVVK